MNQILQVEYYKKSKGPIEMSKIIKFFVIAIIIFAITIIGIGSYAIFTQKQKNDNNKSMIEGNIQPEVNLNQEEDNIRVEITHTLPISKIIYNWNDEPESTIDGKNRTSLSEKIELPFGTNILNLTVIDINGQETKFQKEYVLDGDGKPVIELKLTQDNKIKILAEDKTSLQYITYAWNNDEAIKVDATGESLNKIEYEVDIPAGQNTLKVQAINSNNITQVKELEVKGVKKPVVTLKKEGDYLVIRAEDEVGMKIINYTLGGQNYQINYGDRKLIEYKQLLPKGESMLELVAENQDGGTTTINAKCIN